MCSRHGQDSLCFDMILFAKLVLAIGGGLVILALL